MAASKACASGSCGFVLLSGCLKDRFQIDRHRVVAGCDHVLLVHVIGSEAVEERKPGAGTPEKPLAAFLIGASRMIDEFGPAVTVARDRAHRLQFDRGIGLVQALDQVVPGNVEPQILRLVHDPRAVLEADDLDRMAAIVRIGEIAFDLGNPAVGVGVENVSTDRRQIGVEAQNEFASTCRSTAA